MKITEHVHQIKIDFYVTDKVKRYVYVYLITGKYCYLVDSGTAGASEVIASYMKSIGRDVKEIKGIFLTHAHPDHIGAAKDIREITGCSIYSSEKSVPWTEDIDLQYKERPIPNFYQLVGGSVKIDHQMKEHQAAVLEEGLEMQMMCAAGHSDDSTAWYLKSEKVLFIGDAVPCSNDLPIFTKYDESVRTLEKIKSLPGIKWYCPAWDKCCTKDEIEEILNQSYDLLKSLYQAAGKIYESEEEALKVKGTEKRANVGEEFVRKVCLQLGMEPYIGNPLFKRSILACFISYSEGRLQ